MRDILNDSEAMDIIRKLKAHGYTSQQVAHAMGTMVTPRPQPLRYNVPPSPPPPPFVSIGPGGVGHPDSKEMTSP